MKKNILIKCLALGILALFLMAGCSKRGMPAPASESLSPVQTQESTNEDSNKKSEHVESQEEKPVLPVPQWKSAVGTSVNRHEAQVSEVIITDLESNQVCYETQDEVLAQQFYDALNTNRGSGQASKMESCNYKISFRNHRNQEISFDLLLDSGSETATAGNNQAVWTLPEFESNWIKGQLWGMQ